MGRAQQSTLFPYTTLFRSHASLRADTETQASARHANRETQSRSEEHTSELQSHVNLVCRLLLEKKNVSTATPIRPVPTLTTNTCRRILPTRWPIRWQRPLF